ncbi:YcgL domain-containing protein [Pleionea sp. CnH1-48]|uniref:YcgL domain-containing protein n=1 Tax=Pleionea sp. CnH1-48 TaxID=2954494 RepID=UPI002097F041|nr:YcgL domain-containing protein [Pleionea sp. CnH1-48]MCO7227267.1 YcgL domain-containing protein [Pleionea sp. CnH1-48]
MLCSIYRSSKKDEMYLYITERDDFSSVPEALMKVFGEPSFVMLINLAKRDKLARENIEDVKEALNTQGFYLQMPPVVEANQVAAQNSKASL